MTALVILGVLFLGAAAALLGRSIAAGRVRMLVQVQQIETYGFKVPTAQPEEADTPSRLLVAANALAERLGRFAAERFSFELLERKQLLAAGLYELTPEALNGYRVLLGAGLPALELLNGLSNGRSTLTTILFAIVVGGIGFVVPKLLVVRRAQRRLDHIDRDLPELVDVLTATIEAGLSFAGSLQMVSERFHGPLGSELRLTLREQTMGLSTDQALANLVERSDTPSIRSFVRAVRQAESLGVSIGQMMRALATETRDRRRQLAREKVQKAPVKMLFPLVFLIFPAVFMVLLYPALHTVVTQLGNG